MSELLFVYGLLDERVRPLVFTVRRWAQEVGLTNASPGRWITNFSLTLLVLAFLQRLPSEPILPSLNTLIKLSKNREKSDFQLFGNIKATSSKNSSNLEELLLQFFEYYSNFDFSMAISLNEAAVIRKPEHSPLYIVNPLEKGLNVSKNVSIEELERFRTEVRNATWVLESCDRNSDNWGILSFQNKSNKFFLNAQSKMRLMEVKNLFEDEEEKSQPIKFKNENVKKQVEEIKQETENNIGQLTVNSKTKVKRRQSVNVRKR